MKRNDVRSKLGQVKAAIKAIESDDDVVLYATKEKHLPGVGYIHEVETPGDLAKAHNEIRKLVLNDLQPSIAALGLTEEELPVEDTKVLGFKPSHWYNDINTRLKELRTATRLEKLYNAEASLTKHLSDDDKFDMDTAGVDALLEG